MKLALPLAALLALAAAPHAYAEEAMQGMDHSKMHHAALEAAAGVDKDYAKAWTEALGSMHQNMDVQPTSDPDLDFLKGMIPHHQGAIDMAKIELRYGRDARVKELAEKIIAAQEAEIAEMKRWIEERK